MRLRYLTAGPHCAHCGGTLVRDLDGQACLACGRSPEKVPQEILDTLARGGDVTHKQPRTPAYMSKGTL